MLLQEEWEAKYKPIKNPNNEWGGDYSAFETFSPEVDFVWSKPDNLVWTEIDGDEGNYIIAGKHYVNRLQYYVCDVPWTDENETVVISLEIPCPDCGGTGEEPEEDELGNNDCWNCGGRSFFTRFPHTQEELKELLERQ